VLRGKEASILVFSDGTNYVLMPSARDHKRIGENETGPNTGGMGSITDDSVVDTGTLEQIKRQIIEPTLEGARRDGFPFRGILFFGLMLTKDGPKVLEYNVRFGDPETQAILVRLSSNLLTLFEATITGSLGTVRVEWERGSSACVVLANRGYPGKYETGAIIEGLSDTAAIESVQIFHAGTSKSKGGEFVASGGRVLGVTASGVNLDDALDRCYAAISKIAWEGMQYRRDIGRFI
jgi:phosphoribosylamine--glycine ligase